MSSFRLVHISIRLVGCLIAYSCSLNPASGEFLDTTFFYGARQGDLTKVVDRVGDAMTVGPYDALGDPLGFRVFPDTGNPVTSTNPLITSLDWNAAQELIWARLPNQVTVQQHLEQRARHEDGIPLLGQCSAVVYGFRLRQPSTIETGIRFRRHSSAISLRSLFEPDGSLGRSVEHYPVQLWS